MGSFKNLKVDSALSANHGMKVAPLSDFFLLRIKLKKVVVKTGCLSAKSFAVAKAAAQRLVPQNFLVLFVNHNDRPLFFGIVAGKGHFLHSANVVRVGMGQEKILYVGNLNAELRNRQWAQSSAIDEDMVFALDEKGVALKICL